MLGALTAALVIFVGDTLIERRQRRLDRQNAEALDQIKDALFNEPFSFGAPIVESGMVPDDKIYIVNPEYLYFDGKPVDLAKRDLATLEEQMTMVMNKQSMARIRNLKET